MTMVQTGALIIGSVVILAIILGALLVKENKTNAAPAGIALDPSPAETAAAEPVGDVIAEADEALTGNFDSSALQEGYKKLAKTHKKRLRSINRGIVFFFIIQGAALLILSGIAANAPRIDGGDDGLGFILFIGVALYVGLLVYYISGRNKDIGAAIASVKYVGLGEHQFPTIWHVCRELMGKLDLTGYSLNIFYVKTDAFEANVLVDDYDIYLLLSRSLISYYQSHPKDVESILGHEFGHVHQGDTKMLLVNRRTIQIPGIIGTVSACILMLQLLLALVQGQGLSQTGGSFALVIYYWQLVGLRKEAEYLADMASVAFVEDSTLPALIQQYMPEQGTFNYPSRAQRLRSLEAARKKFAAPPALAGS